MSTNVYVINGHIGLVVATVAATTLNPTGINVLISERHIRPQSQTRMDVQREEYHWISDVLESFFPWNERIHCCLDKTVPKASQPLKYCFFLRYLKSFKNELVAKVSRYDHRFILFASRNTKLWPLLLTAGTFSALEHGASDYCNLLESHSSLGNSFKKTILSLARYPSMTQPDSIILTDGDRCPISPPLRARANGGSQLHSIECQEIVGQISIHLEREYRKKFPEDFKEIERIRGLIQSYDKAYLYLPFDSELIGPEMLLDFIRHQLGRFDKDRTLFIIKNHPRDTTDYGSYLKNLDLYCVSFASRLNQYIPAEFLSRFLGNIPLVGMYSSSLLYANWWFNQIPVFVEVKEEPYYSALTKEFPGLVRNADLWRAASSNMSIKEEDQV